MNHQGVNSGKFWNFWNFENREKYRDFSKGSVINENEISKSKKMKIKRVSNQNGMSISGHMSNLKWKNYHVMLKLIAIILLSRKWSTSFGMTSNDNKLLFTTHRLLSDERSIMNQRSADVLTKVFQSSAYFCLWVLTIYSFKVISLL